MEGGAGETAVELVERVEDYAAGLSARQSMALGWRTLWGAESIRRVAGRVGVSEGTIRHWIRTNVRFARLWEMAVEERTALTRELDATGRIRSRLTLIEAQDGDAPDSVKVDAAAKFLTNDRQERAMETEPQRAGLAAYFEELGKRSAAMLAEAAETMDGAGGGESSE